jgi:DNA-binding response OmpR family regulator
MTTDWLTSRARGLRRLGRAESNTVCGASRGGPGFDLSCCRVLMLPQGTVRAAKPIVLTGATDPASRTIASSLDATDYLVKPVVLEELAAAIKRRAAET